MPSTACVVINCDSTYTDKVTRRHRFPKDTLRFNIWVQRSGNNKLLNKTILMMFINLMSCVTNILNLVIKVWVYIS